MSPGIHLSVEALWSTPHKFSNSDLLLNIGNCAPKSRSFVSTSPPKTTDSQISFSLQHNGAKQGCVFFAIYDYALI